MEVIGEEGETTEREENESSEVEEASSLEEREPEVAEKPNTPNAGSLNTVLQIMRIYDLKGVFPTLYTSLKNAVTLQVASASPERSFSELAIVKNRLRTTMGSERLEDLIIIWSERDIKVDYDSVISYFASNNVALSKSLIYLSLCLANVLKKKHC